MSHDNLALVLLITTQALYMLSCFSFGVVFGLTTRKDK